MELMAQAVAGQIHPIERRRHDLSRSIQLTSEIRRARPRKQLRQLVVVWAGHCLSGTWSATLYCLASGAQDADNESMGSARSCVSS